MASSKRVSRGAGKHSKSGTLGIACLVLLFGSGVSWAAPPNNTADGYGALFNNTTGHDNSAFGYEALLGNKTGSENSALGSDALRINIRGDDNSAFGSS